MHDRKVVGSNLAGSNSDRLVSITCIDGYIMSDKYNMEFPATISGAPKVVSLPPSNSKAVISYDGQWTIRL